MTMNAADIVARDAAVVTAEMMKLAAALDALGVKGGDTLRMGAGYIDQAVKVYREFNAFPQIAADQTTFVGYRSWTEEGGGYLVAGPWRTYAEASQGGKYRVAEVFLMPKVEAAAPVDSGDNTAGATQP